MSDERPSGHNLSIRSYAQDAPLVRSLKEYAESKQIADPFADAYGIGQGSWQALHEPPFSFYSLMRMPQENSILSQCIDAMVTNIDGHGYRMEYIGEDDTGETSPAAVAERKVLEDLLNYPNDDYSMQELRDRVRRDYETIGNAYMEVGRDARGRIVMISHIPAHTVRLSNRDQQAIEVEISLPRDGGKEMKRKVQKRFRRFVQQVGNRRVFFKEYGDPRLISPDNGEQMAQGGGKAALEASATEIIHLCPYNPSSPYGLPRWFSQITSVLGTRQAEMVNLDFFRDNAIPAMMLMVSGGAVTQSSLDAISDHFNTMRGRGSMQRIMVIEATGDPLSADEGGKIPPPKVELKPLVNERQTDATFLEYDKSGMDKIRSSFRIPPLFVGRSEDMTYACYDDKTQVLTDAGWLNYDQFTPGMKIAAFDKETGQIKFECPENDSAFVYDFSGDLFRVRNNNVDVAVTPGHRMLFCNYDGDRQWRVAPVETMTNCRLGVKDTGLIVGGEPLVEFATPHEKLKGGTAAPTQTVAMPIPADTFLKLLGYFVSEGGTVDNPTRATSVTIGQMPGIKAGKGDVLGKIGGVMDTMEALGYTIRKHSPAPPPHAPDMVYHTINHKGLRNWLRKNTGCYSHEKRLPDFVMSLPVDQTQTLLDALMAGDGTYDQRHNRTSMTYYTNSEKLAGQVQVLAMRLGLTAKIRPGTRCFRVQMSTARDCVRVTNKNITREHYEGKVWCFRVSTGLFVTRRNGTVAIQGNTAKTSYEVAEGQVFAPERSRFDDMINLRILSTYMPKYWAFRSNPPRLSDSDALIAALSTFDECGALSPNIAIGIANELFDLNIAPVDEDWGDYPFSMTENLILTNKLKVELENMVPPAPPAGAPGAGGKPLIPPPGAKPNKVGLNVKPKKPPADSKPSNDKTPPNKAPQPTKVDTGAKDVPSAPSAKGIRTRTRHSATLTQATTEAMFELHKKLTEIRDDD